MNNLASWLGRLHPIAVHFPIALIVVAAIAEWFPRGRNAARFLIVLGAAAAVFAAVLGWLDAAHIRIRPDQVEQVLWHRWIGTAAATLAVVSAWASRNQTLLYRVTLIACAVLIAIGAHIGGEIVYGEDYFGW
jgi:uncharacterized membrane protein